MSETFLFTLLAIVTGLVGAFIGGRIASLKLKSETGKLEANFSNSKEQIERFE